MDLVTVLLMLVLFPIARTQTSFSTTAEIPYGDCAELDVSVLGPFGSFDTAVPSLLVVVLYGHHDISLYELYLDEVIITCVAPSFRRGYYSSVAFRARFHCDGSSCTIMGEQTHLIHLVCDKNGNMWSQERSSTDPPEVPYSTARLDVNEPLNMSLSAEIAVCGACLANNWTAISMGNQNPVTGCVGESHRDIACFVMRIIVL